MISVEEALDGILALVAPLDPEDVPLTEARGRVLSAPVRAARAQPPFPSSAMDGYALAAGDARPGARLRVIGQSAAGHGFDGTVGPGEAVRIFTGAPVPPGADRVVIQEDVAAEGDTVTLGETLDDNLYVRPEGGDFRAGDEVFPRRRLGAADLTLLAAMNTGTIRAARQPEVALIATGDELAMPGEAPRPDQIIASNTFGLKAMIEAAGGRARLLPIARDNPASLTKAFDFARGADLVVTIGGASVGDHDIVDRVAAARGMERAFYKIAMRPGKPLMAGRLDGAPMIGLPGNPVSSMVCGHVFVLPALRAMLGLGAAPAPRARAPLAAPVAANGPREHYMRATLGPEGLSAFDRQDSSLMSVFAAAQALIVRPPHDGPRDAGDTVEYLSLSPEA
ncbi:gephyrin-like molybdotransferase Glp [Tranquillimonas rosea]|uniref:molybdopterin molybdotransferase MoeA n=1 Tax=Tranquillimonas rosea TaxID=641238 RepID=UPI003BAA7D41